jgi:L-lactate utilization protein LutC
MREDMQVWNAKPPREVIERTLAALSENGIEAVLAATAEDAKEMVLDMIPAGAEVYTMTSVTLDEMGLSREINDSGRYDGVRKALFAMDPKVQGREQRKLGAAPDFALGSVHAVTETGTLVIASRTGSQLPAYAFGAGTVIWVVGTQKIVKDIDEGLRRVDEYLVDRESARAREAYGLPVEFRTAPNKVLLFNRETQPGRTRLILVSEVVGL